jgi:hypothetical protein
MNNNDFDISPSDLFLRLKADRDEAEKRYFERDRSGDDPDCERLRAEWGVAIEALQQTPEKQFLDEIRDAECAAYTQLLDSTAANVRRMTSSLMFEAPEPGATRP